MRQAFSLQMATQKKSWAINFAVELFHQHNSPLSVRILGVHHLSGSLIKRYIVLIALHRLLSLLDALSLSDPPGERRRESPFVAANSRQPHRHSPSRLSIISHLVIDR
jgi:hypothetical protein